MSARLQRGFDIIVTMKRKTILSTVLAAGLALTGCSRVSQEADKAAKEAENAVTEPAESISFTDDAGRTITLDKQPDRVAALIGSFADIWCTAGGSETLVAAAGDAWTSFDLDLPDSVQDLGAVKSPNTEVLLSTEPDFVLASLKTEADKELEPVLENQGIPVAYFEVSDFDDYLRMLDICTQLTGDDEAYQTRGLDQQAQIDADIRRAETKPAWEKCWHRCIPSMWRTVRSPCWRISPWKASWRRTPRRSSSCTRENPGMTPQPGHRWRAGSRIPHGSP